jgi:hypothetical protein
MKTNVQLQTNQPFAAGSAPPDLPANESIAFTVFSQNV